MSLTPQEREQKKGWIVTTRCMIHAYEKSGVDFNEQAERYRRAIKSGEPLRAMNGRTRMPTQHELRTAISGIGHVDQQISRLREKIAEVQAELEGGG